MAEESLDLVLAGALPDEERRAGVPEVMKPHGLGKACCDDRGLEVPPDPGVPQGSLCTGRENQSLGSAWPSRHVVAKDVGEEPGQRQTAPARLGLQGSELKVPLRLDELPPLRTTPFGAGRFVS